MALSPGPLRHALLQLITALCTCPLPSAAGPSYPTCHGLKAPKHGLAVPPALNRRERRVLTASLNCHPSASEASAPVWDPLRGFQCSCQVSFRRASRQLFAKQRATWCRQPRGWSGWPYRGKRVGEALHPGPGRERSPARASHPSRVFCPVPGCPASDASTARGWATHASMRPHLEAHAAGTLAGAVPSAYCRAQGLDHCSVCGMLVAARYNGTHCRCRPAARAAAAPVPPSAPAGGHDSLPDLASIFSADIPVLRHLKLPAACGRSVWPGLSATSPSATPSLLGVSSSCFQRLSCNPPLGVVLGAASKQLASPNVVAHGGLRVSGRSCGRVASHGAAAEPLVTRMPMLPLPTGMLAARL